MTEGTESLFARRSVELAVQVAEAAKPLGHLPGVPTFVCEKLVARGEAIDTLLAALIATESERDA